MVWNVRILVFAAVVAAGVVSLTGPVHAQIDFTIGQSTGTFFYGYYGQAGPRGFFGPYDVDASASQDFAPLNIWAGNRAPDMGELATGTNSAVASIGLTTNPSVGNQWVKVKGRYNITMYDLGTTQGSYVSMSPGQLSMWSMKLDTPLANIHWGKRELVHGCGLQFGQARTHEHLCIERGMAVPNVLARIVAAGLLPRAALSFFNPSAWGKYSRKEEKKKEKEDEEEAGKGYYGEYVKEDEPKEDEGPYKNADTFYAMGELAPGYLKLGYGVIPWRSGTSWNAQDLNSSPVSNWMAYLLYWSEDMVFGLGTLRSTDHLGPELQQTATLRNNTPTTETYISEGWAYAKYNNGRIFISTEVDWFNRVTRYQRSANGVRLINGLYVNSYGDTSGRSVFASDYNESWRYMVEAGTWLGPWGLRFAYSFMPGPDRRHGVLIDRQPFIQANAQTAADFFDPYSALASHFYGGGVNAPAHISDATVYAAKVDFQIAANLVAEATVMKAFRTSQGYGWGYIRPSLPSDNGAFGTVDYNVRGTYDNPSPAIPDNDLGWELSAGAIWKLLEGWAIDGRFSYWQPGKWFNYACVDRSVPNWDTPGPGNNWGVNPDRRIDPVIAFELRFEGSY
ncbi:MAG: hypothetical protein V2B18_17500 [Pseudomonadota bacterium]